jgi:hypothetical protein
LCAAYFIRPPISESVKPYGGFLPGANVVVGDDGVNNFSSPAGK